MPFKKILLITIFLSSFLAIIAQGAEYKIIHHKVIPNLKGSGDWVEADPLYTSWETVDGTKTCESWQPAIAQQISDFEQSRVCDVKQVRDRTDREYNTTLDEYRNLNTEQEERLYELPDNETRLISVYTPSWQDVGGLYNCTEWTPDESDYYENEQVEQSRECSQDQQRTLEYSHDAQLLNTYDATQIETITQTQTVSGTQSFHANCNAILNNGYSTGDGLYTISPDGQNNMEVYCDMTTDGGGWTVVMGNNAPENLLQVSDYNNNGNVDISNNLIGSKTIQCPGSDWTIRGAQTNGLSTPISYSQTRVELGWNGTGAGDHCAQADQDDGVYINGNFKTVDAIHTQTFSSFPQIRATCACLNGNSQEGHTTGKIMVR